MAVASTEILIAGTRGIPNRHGGFESFAEQYALHLAATGRSVTVACQSDTWRGGGTTRWNGVKLVHLPALLPGPLGSIVFDLLTVLYALRHRPVVLTLGYNSAFLFVLYRLFGIVNVVNMDGIEWQRSKWSRPVKLWFFINERIAMHLGSSLVADHPAIAQRLRAKVPKQRIATIPYGAPRMAGPAAAALDALGLVPNGYALVVARPEPENSILEIVQGFVAADVPGELVVLGRYEPKENGYHRQVVKAANGRVRFVGAIYDRPVVETLRSQAWLYLHGHQVGGTNPSLVEALAAGCAVLAHGNVYNAWVAGPDMAFFADAASCAAQLRELAGDDARLAAMRQSAGRQFEQLFRLEPMFSRYNEVLAEASPVAGPVAEPFLRPELDVQRTGSRVQ